MLKKLIMFAITSGLASKAYRAFMNRQRTAPVAQAGTRPAPTRGRNTGR